MASNPTPGSALLSPGQPLPMQPGEFTPTATPNTVSIGTKEVSPPSLLYIQQDDLLTVLSQSSIAAEQIKLTGRYLRADDGVIVPFQFQFAVGSAYVTSVRQFTLGEGWLLSASLTCTSATERGKTFASLSFTRGLTSTAPFVNNMALLCAGYITTDQPNGWPNGIVENANSGNGAPLSINVTDPAAGANIAWNTGHTSLIRIHSLKFRLNTSAAVANRQITAVFGGQWQLFVPAVASQVASTNQQYYFLPHVQPYTGADGSIVLPLPDTNLWDGSTGNPFLTQTGSLQAGDQYTGLTIGFEEWLLL
jgi:hypothetical protein